MSRDVREREQSDQSVSGGDLGSRDRLVGRWGRTLSAHPDLPGVEAVGPKGKKVDGRTRAGRALRATRESDAGRDTRRNPGKTRANAGETETTAPDQAVPASGATNPRNPMGVRFPSVRNGSGRKQQYGNPELGTRLRVWRERAGLARSALAVCVGVTSPNISHYERGTRAPSKEVCKRLRIVLCLTDAEYIQLLEWS